MTEILPSRARSLLAAGLAVVLALATAPGCKRDQAVQPPPPPQEVTLSQDNVAVAERATLASGPAISGTLRARQEATLRAELPGSVLDAKVEEGQAVKPGQLLARIEATTAEDQVSAARAAVRSAENALQVARLDLERARQLAEAGAIARRDLDRAEAAVAQQDAVVAEAQARLASATEAAGNRRVTAPFAGVVSERHVAAGDIVQPGAPLYTVVDPTGMRLEASVPAEHLARVTRGTRVDFGVTGYPGRTFAGTIEQVNPVVDPATGQVRIYVAIPNAGGTLLAGLFAKGRVVTESKEAIAAPADAVDVSGTSPMVMKIDGGAVRRVPVELGIRDEVSERVEIRAGVSEGELLLLGSARAGLAEGARVRLARGEDATAGGQPPGGAQ